MDSRDAVITESMHLAGIVLTFQSCALHSKDVSYGPISPRDRLEAFGTQVMLLRIHRILNTHLYKYMYASLVCVQQGERVGKKTEGLIGSISVLREWPVFSPGASDTLKMFRISNFTSSTQLAITPTGNAVGNRWLAVLLMLSMKGKASHYCRSIRLALQSICTGNAVSKCHVHFHPRPLCSPHSALFPSSLLPSILSLSLSSLSPLPLRSGERGNSAMQTQQQPQSI